MTTHTFILASGSKTRFDMLQNAGLTVQALPARVDERSLQQSLESEKMSPRDIADALAEAKAKKVASKNPEAIVFGCDQVLDHNGQILTKPETVQQAQEQVSSLSGRTHYLHSAIVMYENAQPTWRHVGQVKLHMRQLSPSFIQSYVHSNWPSLSETVGGYKLEEQGSRLFHRIEGDYFTVLGLPLLDLLTHLAVRGLIDT